MAGSIAQGKRIAALLKPFYSREPSLHTPTLRKTKLKQGFVDIKSPSGDKAPSQGVCEQAQRGWDHAVVFGDRWGPGAGWMSFWRGL